MALKGVIKHETSVPPLLMRLLENCVITLLALWVVASICFMFRVPWIRPIVQRMNWFLSFLGWGVFNSGDDPSIRPAVFEIEYRDRQKSGDWTEWSCGGSGYSWAWYCFLWWPDEMITGRIQNLGRDIKSCITQNPVAIKTLARHRRVLEGYLQRTHPCPPGQTREIRLVRCFNPMEEAPRVVMVTFPAIPDAHRP